MQVEILSEGILDTNTYIVSDGTECVIIDAGNSYKKIQNILSKHLWEVKYLILTHGHYDHICYADEIRKATGAKLVIHENEQEFLENPFYNASSFFEPMTVCKADILVKEGDEISFGSISAKFIHTPGHTPGGVCVRIENTLFSGDTLFKNSIGRTDLPGGDHIKMSETLREKILPLEDALVVYPGHGDSTTIGTEKKYNPYLNPR